eukprot:1595357-Prymnesium_polylepis.1
MAWHRVVPQHRCAPVSVDGTRCTLRAPSRRPAVQTNPKSAVTQKSQNNATGFATIVAGSDA